MGRPGGTSIAADTSPRRRVAVDVILLLTWDGCILLRERANTGYGDGAYEPPSGQLADRETIVETAIRVASDAGIVIGTENVSLAHVMQDVSGGGRIAFFLAVSAWAGHPASPDVGWFPLCDLPTNMLDRARVALRNCVGGMRFSTYPSFALAGAGAADVSHVIDRASGAAGPGGVIGPPRVMEPAGVIGLDDNKELFGAGESYGANGVSGAKEFASRNASSAWREEAYSGRLLG